MNPLPEPEPAPAPHPDPRGAILAGGALLVLATVAAYHGSFSGPFLFDDRGSIAENPTIRHLSSALSPPSGGVPVAGRPVANLSLAVNYAVGGLNVRGYHVVNLAIHILAGLTLFGVARRTFLRWSALSPTRWATPFADKRVGDNALHLGFAVALLWTLHPLQTEAVTYLSQRAESLMGLFYLLTLYCFIRSVDAGAETEARRLPLRSGSRLASVSVGWAILSFLACLCGMATKEVMVSAPVMVFLYDRTFVAGTFRAAWRLRRRFYLGLAATWLPLGYLVARASSRGGTAGFGAGVAWWEYAVTQFRAIVLYLRLSLWPHPLVADYGRVLGGPPLEVIGGAIVVLLLAAATGAALWKRPALGFLGAWFFAILAPSSSVVPVATEIIAERRMYLSLAAVVVLAVYGLSLVLVRPRGFLTAVALLGVGLGTLTARRNTVYRSVEAFWTDAVLKVPENAGARNNLGNALAEQGRYPEAVTQFEAALSLEPDYADAHHNLGNALFRLGRFSEAVEHYRSALRKEPDDHELRGALGLASYRLGNTLEEAGQFNGAAQAYASAEEMRPGVADVHVDYGNVLVQLGRRPEAMREFAEALRLEPGAADVHNNLGGLLAGSGQWEAAKVEFAEALRLKPDYREARDNLERVNELERAGAGR